MIIDIILIGSSSSSSSSGSSSSSSVIIIIIIRRTRPPAAAPTLSWTSRWSATTTGKLCLFFQEPPKIFGDLREFTGECNLGILYSSSLL